MSIIRPKDGDYIVRGLFLLIVWAVLGWVPFAIAGALLAGPGGATVTTIGCLLISPVLYQAYLRLDPKKIKKCECGHSARAHYKNTNGCQYLWNIVHNPMVNGCQCQKYKAARWWRTNAQDPHDWSV